MPRRRYLFDPPDRFVAGTVGEPGHRAFFLQARDGARVVSILLEKVQVAVLADRLGELLNELERRGIPEVLASGADPTPGAGDTGPLDEPLNEAFRAGSLTLGWDGTASRILVEARAQDEDGPDLLRVRITAADARSFVARASRVIASGRPPCPLCGQPLDPQGHICPRRNGPYVN